MKYFQHIAKVLCSLLVLSAVSAHAQIVVSKARINALIDGSTITAAYMSVVNNSNQAVRLVKVTSDISDRIEIHQHQMVDEMMVMLAVDSVELNSNKAVVFQPFGFHLMVFDVKKSFKDQNSIKMTLHFSDNTQLAVDYAVKGLNHAPKVHHH